MKKASLIPLFYFLILIAACKKNDTSPQPNTWFTNGTYAGIFWGDQNDTIPITMINSRQYGSDFGLYQLKNSADSSLTGKVNDDFTFYKEYQTYTPIGKSYITKTQGIVIRMSPFSIVPTAYYEMKGKYDATTKTFKGTWVLVSPNLKLQYGFIPILASGQWQATYVSAN